MCFRKLLFVGVAVFLCLAGTARAQFGVYGMYEGTDTTSITCLSTTVACSSPGGNVKPFGGVVGVYYDFKTIGPMRLGGDFRGEFLHANKSAADSVGGQGVTRVHSALGGVRASFKTPISFLRPYAQISAGWASSNATERCVVTATFSGGICSAEAPFDNFLKYEVFAGADIRVFPILDLRPIELGIGGMSRIGSGSSGGSTSLGVRSIGAGLVFHLP